MLPQFGVSQVTTKRHWKGRGPDGGDKLAVTRGDYYPPHNFLVGGDYFAGIEHIPRQVIPANYTFFMLLDCIVGVDMFLQCQ